MAKSMIPEGKRRYSITLTVEKVNEFRKLCSEFSLPRNTLSNVLDDQLQYAIWIVEGIQKARKMGQSQIDILKIVDQVMQEKKQLKLFEDRK